ncbi:MAG: DUF2059 domain-containing protein [Bryobacteraceae bacterium]|jgi:hypothetical protein
MFTVRILVLAALLIPAGLASDQDRRALAEELMTVMHPEKLVDQAIQQVSSMMQQQIRSMKVPADAQASADQMSQEMMSYVREKLDWAKLRPQFVDMYADVFTEDELRQVVAFYKSPGGQAFLSKSPQLMQRSMVMMQGQMADLPARMQEMTAKIQKQIEEKQKQAAPKAEGQN